MKFNLKKFSQNKDLIIINDEDDGNYQFGYSIDSGGEIVIEYVEIKKNLDLPDMIGTISLLKNKFQYLFEENMQ